MKSINIDFFRNKKIVLFCPHEDDEINLGYGLLLMLKDVKCNVKVVYSTNGDKYTKAKYRYSDAINSLKVFGIDKKSIIFLGYPDQHFEGKTHFYNTDFNYCDYKTCYTSSPYNNDYCFVETGVHNKINKHNFIEDIYMVLKKETPDIVIGVDLDSHPDHRALSLALEHALGSYLKEYPEVFVMKCFAYPTAYRSFFDFKNQQLLPTFFKTEEYNKYNYQNPYYTDEDILCLNVSKYVNNKFLPQNKVFKAIIQHHSQSIVKKTYAIINSTQMFFYRKYNMTIDSIITSSSGDSKFLNDYLRFDLSNVLNGNKEYPTFDLGYTRFSKSDKKKTVSINFKKMVQFNSIEIFKAVDCNNQINKVLIDIGKTTIEQHVIEKDNKYTINLHHDVKTKNISINFFTIYDDNLDITEIEVYNSKNSIFINEKDKLIEKNDKISILNRIIFIIDDLIILVIRYYHKFLRIFQKIL